MIVPVPLPPTEKNRPRTPLDEKIKNMKDEKELQERSKIEQRILTELPIEVERKMQGQLNLELERMKKELHFQQNVISEQILNLKVKFKNFYELL